MPSRDPQSDRKVAVEAVLADALSAFHAEDSWMAAPESEREAIMRWLCTEAQDPKRSARHVAQWLSADRELAVEQVRRYSEMMDTDRRIALADQDDPVPSATIPDGLAPDEALTHVLQRRRRARATWAMLEAADRSRLQGYANAPHRQRARKARAHEVARVLAAGSEATELWLNWFKTPDAYRTLRRGSRLPMDPI